MLRVLLHEPCRLLAESLGHALQERGCAVTLAPAAGDVLPSALHRPPDVVVVADLLDRTDVRPLVEELLGAAAAPLLVVADLPPTELPGGLPEGALSVVGRGRPLSTVLRAVEEAARGKPVLAPDVHEGPGRGRHAVLTARERQVLALLGEGASTGEMAGALGVSVSTARTYVQQVLRKLGAHSRVEALAIVGPVSPRPGRSPVQRDRRRARRVQGT